MIVAAASDIIYKDNGDDDDDVDNAKYEYGAAAAVDGD